MDPQETLDLCIEALRQQDYEACFYHAQDLRTWLSKGGCAPCELLAEDLAMWCKVTMRICKQQQWDKGE